MVGSGSYLERQDLLNFCDQIVVSTVDWSSGRVRMVNLACCAKNAAGSDLEPPRSDELQPKDDVGDEDVALVADVLGQLGCWKTDPSRKIST